MNKPYTIKVDKTQFRNEHNLTINSMQDLGKFLLKQEQQLELYRETIIILIVMLLISTWA